MEQHGGRPSVESEPGRTAFTLALPAAAATVYRAAVAQPGFVFIIGDTASEDAWRVLRATPGGAGGRLTSARARA